MHLQSHKILHNVSNNTSPFTKQKSRVLGICIPYWVSPSTIFSPSLHACTLWRSKSKDLLVCCVCLSCHIGFMPQQQSIRQSVSRQIIFLIYFVCLFLCDIVGTTTLFIILAFRHAGACLTLLRKI